MFFIKYALEVLCKKCMVTSCSEFLLCCTLASHECSLFSALSPDVEFCFFPTVYITHTKHSCVYVVDSNACLGKWSCGVRRGLEQGKQFTIKYLTALFCFSHTLSSCVCHSHSFISTFPSSHHICLFVIPYFLLFCLSTCHYFQIQERFRYVFDSLFLYISHFV